LPAWPLSTHWWRFARRIARQNRYERIALEDDNGHGGGDRRALVAQGGIVTGKRMNNVGKVVVGKWLVVGLAAALTGCSAVTVIDAEPSARCMLIAPVKYSLSVPDDSADQGTPLDNLRARVLESCKEEARNAGANVLFVTDRGESRAAGRKALTLNCSGMAYACP
jgi:hypothetical protein